MAITNKRYIKNCTGNVDIGEKNKKRARTIARIIFYVLCFGFFIITLYVLFFSPFLQINNLEILGAQQLNANEIKQTIDESIEGKYLKIIPKNNYLFISQSNIENLLIDNYKKIRSVSIKKQFPDTVLISIDERKALLIWCTNEQSCFLIDENGTAYNKADFNAPELVQNNLLRIDDQSGAPVQVGDKVIDAGFEQYLTSLKDAMKGVGFDLNDSYSTPSRMAEEIDAKTKDGMDLRFSTQFPLDSALRTLAVIVKKQIKDQINNVAYIDLRVENEAFYKLNGDNQQEVVSGGTSTQAVSDTGSKKAENKK